MLFQRASNQALWEGVLALTAAVLVGVAHRAHVAARQAAQDARSRRASQRRRCKAGAKALLGVFLFTLLMITREGMETALLMGTLLFQVRRVEHHRSAPSAGTLCAAFVAWLWSRYGHRVNLALFFQVTAVFLAVFVVQLLIYGFHELTEANLFPYSEPLHWATEPYGPDGRYGQYLTYLLVALPVGWLALSAFFGPKRSATHRAIAAEPPRPR